MAGLNTTGLPRTEDYNLGRGRVYFSSLTAGGLPDDSGYRFLGNCPEFNITIETETLEHQSSQSGLKVTDKRFVISQEVQVAFTLDELNFQNMSLFLSGTTETFDNPHDTTWVGHESSLVTSSAVLGRHYDLKDDNGVRVYNLDATGCVYSFEEDPAGTPTVLVAGTDYTIDEKMGVVFLLSTATNVAAGEVVGFAITTGATTPQDLDQVNALQVGSIVGALKFISENPGDADKESEYQFHKVTINSTGDLELVGDEVLTAQFEGVAEANSGVPDTSKTLTVRTYDAQ